MQETCKICNKTFARLARHTEPAHGIKYKDYLLKYVLNNIVPLCACGCGKETPFSTGKNDATGKNCLGFRKYIHNHHLPGHEVSKETRQKIGTKNSVNMKNYFKENVDAMLKHVEQMQAGKTEETEAKRIEAVKNTYKTIDKTPFIEHTKRLWKDDSGIMQQASQKAKKTWQERYENSEYDFTERDNKISATVSRLYLEGGFEWSRGEYTSTKMNETHYYRSSWELLYMKHLDSSDNIVEWFYEPFIIKYELDGKQKRYLPDFQVHTSNNKLLIEIKPVGMTKTEMSKAKCKAALEWCKNNNYEYQYMAYDKKSDTFVINDLIL